MDSTYQFYQSFSKECKFGGPGSTIDFWAVSVSATRLTLGVKMHSTAAFLSMTNADGTITGGTTMRGFSDGTERGYPLLLALSTKQISNIVKFDEEILTPKQGNLPSDSQMHVLEDPSDKLEAIKHECATYYLDGYLMPPRW